MGCGVSEFYRPEVAKFGAMAKAKALSDDLRGSDIHSRYLFIVYT